MSLELVRDSRIQTPAVLSRPASQIVELSAQQVYDGPEEVFDRLAKRAEIILVRQLPEVLHVRELLLNFIRQRYSEETALRVKTSLFERKGGADEHTVSAFVAAARHIRDTGAMSALFSRLVQSFELPPPVNIDCGHFRLVLPRNDLFARMDSRRDLAQRDDWYYAPPNDGAEPIFDRGSAMPHRDISRPHYAFQINLWFPLIDLCEDESLIFFPDSYYDYKERIERLTGTRSQGFTDDVRQAGARIAANPNPREWGFGEPATRKLKFGDIYMFYCQQVHGSPVRRDDTLRLSMEVRVACRSLDDNTSYRRIFSNLNNFLPPDENDDTSAIAGIRRADAMAALGDNSAGLLHDPAAEGAGTDVCAQLYVNSLFPTPIVARKAKEVAQPADMFDLGPQVTGAFLKNVAEYSDQFPFADDRYFLLARLFLRRGEDETAATIIGKASQRSQSYFWQLHFAYLAIRAHRKDVARTILARCRALAERTTVDANPFAPALETPKEPILAILPEHALRAVAAISESVERLPDGRYGRDVWYLCDPRLFHPHNYFMRAHGAADFYKTGSLYVGIPTKQPFIPEDIVHGKFAVVCFGETAEELEYEYGEHAAAFTAIAPQNVASAASAEPTLKPFIEQQLLPLKTLLADETQRVRGLETTLDERTHRLATLESTLEASFHRLATLESTLEERSNRITSLEASLDERDQRLRALEDRRRRGIWYRIGSLVRRRIPSGAS